MDHVTEMQRIIDGLPKEVVERCGVANLLSDLTHEFLLDGLPSRELREQMCAQIQADDPTADALPEN